MSVEVSDREYVQFARWKRQATRSRVGCGTLITGLLMLAMIAAFAILTANTLGYIPPSLYGAYIGTPQAVFSTPAVPAQQQSVTQPQQRYTPFFSQPGAAPVAQPAPILQDGLPGATATATPMPTQEGEFWTPEEQTAFSIEATATSEAFYNDIPTAPPEFVQYTQEQCKDTEKVKVSWFLQQMCGASDDN